MTSNESSPSAVADQAKPRYWRSLSELHQREDFQQYIDREFPVAASEFPEGVSRRRWMQLMGASFAVAGVSGCRYPVETIEPFVIRPEGRIPGESYSRATNIELAGRVYNLLISCFDGRPLKIEPNTEHPSGGGTDVYAQACILGLYDPDRSRGDDGFLLRKVDKRRRQVGWEEFDSFGEALIREAKGHDNGAGFAVLIPPTASPSVLRMLRLLKERLPKATISRYDSVDGDVMRAATQQALGKPAKQLLQLDEADVIVSIQADILGSSKGMLGNAASFAKRRNPTPESADDMSRLYVVEGGYTSTGAMADSRLALRPSQMPAFLSELGRRVEKLAGGESEEHAAESKAYDEISAQERLERFLDVLARDVAAAGDKAVVVVGEHLGADAVAAGIHLNQTLGSFGKLQTFVADTDSELEATVTIGQLVEKVDRGEIGSLLILGGNPAWAAPGDVDLASAIGKVEHSVYLGEYDDETGAICEWSLPLAHPLESWGDCFDDQGHYGVCQPQILPLLGGRTVIEVLAVMLGEKETDGSQIVRRTADGIAGESLSLREWRKLLHDGYADSLRQDSEPLKPIGEYKELTSDAPVAGAKINRDEIEVIFVPADGIYDGRFANNGWLQEMPQSLTKLTWDNAAVMSRATARAVGSVEEVVATDDPHSPQENPDWLHHGQLVTLSRGDDAVQLPVYEMPGCAPGVITATIGYGRTRAGMVGGMLDDEVDVVGVDVSPIRKSDAMLTAFNVKARPKYENYELATTQDHWAIDERGREETESRSFTLVREGTTKLLKKIPEFAESKGPHVPHVGRSGSPWHEPINKIEQESKQQDLQIPQWGMSIDLTKCTGCNACVIACQSENNVPIVGQGTSAE